MKRVLSVTLLVLFAVAAPLSAQSIPVPPCLGGSPAYPNQAGKVGSNGWLMYTISTTVGYNVCVTQVEVKARFSGIPDSSMVRTGMWTASAQKQVPAPRPDTYVAIGEHATIWMIPFPPFIFGVERGASQSASIEVTWEDEEEVDCSALNGGGNYFEWSETEGRCVEIFGSPIVIDMTGDGYLFTNPRNGVWFDLDADGQLDRTGWTRRDAEIAFLALDRNGNGTIDNGTELFGNFTPVPIGGTAANGFEALRFYDSGVPADLTITDRDPIFDRLLLWIDRNHNGISEPDELLCLADGGVAAISLNYRTTRRTDRYGNEFRQVAKLTWVKGKPTNIYDVWFRRK